MSGRPGRETRNPTPATGARFRELNSWGWLAAGGQDGASSKDNAS
jgi:hypothetical protein